MKKVIFFIVIALIVHPEIAGCQTNSYVYTVAGGGSSGLGDGGPATSAEVASTEGVWLDAVGNVYISDMGNSLIRKVNSATGIITTIAGGGTSFLDGIPATSAKIYPYGIGADGRGNVYIADDIENKIRKVDAVSGIITTVAGGGSSLGDGGPATDALVYRPQNVYVDGIGNLYIAADSRIRKVNGATGIITTIAGNGTTGYLGDGAPATDAEIDGGAAGMIFDAVGNFYFADRSNNVIRKIDAATGNIYTVAGTGVWGYSGDGGPATNAELSGPISLAIDCFGNLVIGDNQNDRIRRVDASTGIISNLAGGGSSSAEGASATSTSIHPEFLYLDLLGNIYYSNYGNKVRKATNFYPGLVGKSIDSFIVSVNRLCSGPQLFVQTFNYHAGMTVTTWYGDGTTSSAPILSGYSGGYAVFNHSYANSGTYTIKQVLYSGIIPIDSFQVTNYEYIFCSTIPVQFYNDINGNCKYDTGIDGRLSVPILTEIDSGGIAIDTISSTTGFYYTAYGAPGDIYTIKVISLPGNMHTSCPLSGIITDTLVSGIYNNSPQYIGLNCGTGSSFDLSVHAEIPVTGVNDQWGDIYLSNVYCAPTNAVLTVTYSPKYIFTGDAFPAPTSFSGNTLTWNLTGLSSLDAAPTHIHYQVDIPKSGPLTIGDTVHTSFTITPVTGDVNTTNNTQVILDTIRAGCDPNEMEVIPDLCIPSGLGATQLQYTINFENTGNDTAFNIYVMDTLSPNVDPRSLRIVMASANMNIAPFNDGIDNIVKFDFPQVNLLDSSHHNQCNGTVIFTINTKSGLSTGSNIFNHAGIFFDDNAVVTTNTVNDVVGCPMAALNTGNVLNNKTVEIFPNPATDELTIKMDNTAYNAYTITNSIGQVMLQNGITNAQTVLSVKTLPAGLYYIMLRGDNGTKVMKFVKM